MPAIHFDITGDNDNVIQSLQETIDKLEQFSDVAKTLSDAGIDMSNSETALKATQKYVDELGEAIKGISDVIDEYKSKMAEATEAGDTSSVEEYKSKIDELTEAQSQLNQELGSAQSAVQVLNDSFDETAESASKTEGAMVKLLGGQKNYNEIINNLPGPLKNVVSGLNGMVKAARAFIATPLGLVLTPLILGFSALYKWLNKTAEGQQALAKITGYLKGVLAGLEQVAFDVGRSIYNAFTNPKQAITNLWQTIKNDLIGRLKGVSGVFVNFGKIIGNAFKGNFKEAGEAAKAMANDYQKIFTGKDVSQIKDDVQAVTNRVKGIHQIGQAQSELSARENKLHRDRTAWLYEEAELDKQIAEQRNKMRMGSKEDRAEASKRLQELVDQKTEKNVALAREEYEIKKASNALTDSSQEDLDEEERLRARVVQLETQGVTQKGFALRIQDSMNRQLGVSSEKLSELINKENELLDNLTEKQGQQGLETAALSVASMKDGFDKEMAEQDLEHQQRMAAIEKEQQERLKKIEEFQKAEYKARHGSLRGFTFDEDNEMSSAAKEIYENDIQNESERQRQALAQVYKKYTDEYRGFLTEWEELTEKFENDRKAILSSDALTENPEVWAELTLREKEAFEQLAESWAKSGRDSGLAKWFEELSQQSLADLEIMLSDLENEMDLLGENLPENDLKKLKAQILLVNKAIKDGNYDDNTKELVENAEKATVNWADLNKVLTDTAALFKEAGDAIGGKFGESLKLVGNFTTSVAKIGNAAEAYKEAAKNSDKIGKITSSLTIAGAAVSIFSEIAGRIKEAKERTEEVDRATKAYQRTLKQIHDSKILESFTNAFGTDTFGQFVRNMTVVREAGNSISSISKSLAGDTTTIKNWGKALAQSALGPLGTLFGIGTAAKKGKTVTADLISDMRTGWQKLWGSDKNIMTASISDFFDSNGNLLGEKLQEWYKTYGEGLSEENKAIVEDMLAEFDRLEDSKSGVKSYLSSMFGDIASDISSDMVDSFIETGDVIQDMSKYMNDFGKSVAKSIVQSKLMNKVFEGEEDAIADMLSAGQTSAAIDRFNELMQRAKEQAPEIEAFLAGLDLQNMAGEAARTASSKSSLGASQESIDESNGRLTAIQAQVFQMTEVVTSFKTDYERIIATTAATLQHTQGIHVDTTELKGMVSEMRELSRSVNRNINEMVDKGLKMK